jgi:hypothetical protein
LPYAAPEQAGGRAGPAADLWAVGATLWFAVEGAAPFERGRPAVTLGAILHEPPGHPARAGPLGPVLLALLDKDPARRPPAVAVRHLLEPLAAAPAATVPWPAPPRSYQQPPPRGAGPGPARHGPGAGGGGGRCWPPR